MSWYRYSSPLLDLLKLREPNLNIFISGVLFCVDMTSTTQSLRRVRVPNRRYVDVDGEDEDRNISPMDKFRQDVFQVINDQLIIDLKYRLEGI